MLVWKCLLTATWLCDLPATLSLSSRSLGLEPWLGGRASVGTLWDQTRVPPSHPLFHLSTVFLSHQLPSPCSGRAAGGVCSPPPCAKLSTTEHTGFLRAAWQEGLPEGKGRQQGRDLRRVLLPVHDTDGGGGGGATVRKLLPDPVSSHAFAHLIFTAAGRDKPRLGGAKATQIVRGGAVVKPDGMVFILCSAPS